jgi:hypothetical protein
MQHKLKIKLLTLLLVLITTTVWAVGSSKNEVIHQYLQKTARQHVSLFFLQQAKQVSIKPVGKNCYNFTFTGLNPGLLYFSDSPQRLAGHMSEKEFLSLWHTDHAKPNIALHGYLSSTSYKNYIDPILRFSKPDYDAVKNAFSYYGCVNDAKNQAKMKVNTLYNVSLFIDSLQYLAGG